VTASYDIPSEYKIYTGRLFSLRRCKNIAGANTKTYGDASRRSYNNLDTFGAAVLILDESNAKVLVTTLMQNPLWIAKYHLREEIDPPDDKEKINILIDMLVNTEVYLSDAVRKEIAQYLRK
jgi:hypothetical protein